MLVSSARGLVCIDYTCMRVHVHNESYCIVMVDSTDGSGNLECMALAAHSSQLSPERQS